MNRPELTTVKNDAAADHEAVAPLFAWYVNGTLDTLDTRRVESHLAVCAGCRADVQAERSLARFMRESPAVELAPQTGLAAVMDRIERREARRRWWSWPLRQLRGGNLRPLAFAVGIQAIVIVMLTAVLWVQLAPATTVAPTPAQYRTLSSPATTPAGTTLLRLVLADEMSLGELREALAPWHSRIVTGPEGQGIYTISIEGDATRALESLRATPGVRLVERVSGS